MSLKPPELLSSSLMGRIRAAWQNCAGINTGTSQKRLLSPFLFTVSLPLKGQSFQEGSKACRPQEDRNKGQ